MKINTLSTFIALGFIFALFTSSMRDPNNPPTGKTGAPGETTCGQPNCHSGGAFTGTVTLTGVPDTVLFGKTYSLTIHNMSNAVRAGFQLTCLDSLNAKCGNLTSAPGVSIGTGNNRQYARQSSPKNLSGGTATWTFNWTAPTTSPATTGTFFFVSLCANSNGQKTGDNVLISAKPIVFTATSSAREPLTEANVKIFPTQVTDVLHIKLIDATSGRVTLLTTDGRIALLQDIESDNTLNVSHLPNGAYIVRVETNAGKMIRKFVKY